MGDLNKIRSFLNKSLGGIFLGVVGVISMYYFIYLPVEGMKQQLVINYSYKGILIGPAIFVMGFYILIFTRGGRFSLQNLSSKEKKLFYLAVFIGLALGFVALCWFKNQLAMNGYNTSE